MIAKLSITARITAEELRANRALRAELTGEIHPDLRGDLSGLRGKIPADLAGDIDACEISEQERENGVDISTLIAGGAA